MDRTYAVPLDIAHLADVASVSEAHFIRTFKATFGETPHRYLQRRRVERAMFLLRETERSITDICMDVGFNSLGTFSRTFSDDFNLFAPQTASTSTTRVGWALGTGLEYAITRNWSVKGEYLYTDLGGASNAGLIGTTAFSGPMTGHATLVRQTARLGVNYHF